MKMEEVVKLVSGIPHQVDCATREARMCSCDRDERMIIKAFELGVGFARKKFRQAIGL